MKQFPILLTLLLSGMLAACSTTPDGPAPSDTFSDTGLGFSITKPSEWHFISDETLKADRNTIRLSDAELEQLAKRNVRVPR
jgi:hypothetical protein